MNNEPFLFLSLSLFPLFPLLLVKLNFKVKCEPKLFFNICGDIVFNLPHFLVLFSISNFILFITFLILSSNKFKSDIAEFFLLFSFISLLFFKLYLLNNFCI